MLKHAALLALVTAAASASLKSNAFGQAQELKSSSSVCEGRSSVCSVLLDVPAACVKGGKSACPIAFFLHGHTGNNKGYPHNGAGKGVHAHSFIGVYPQGEIYDGQSGWNDGSMAGNQCAWDDYSCAKDPNDGVFAATVIAALRARGAGGRVYMWGGSNGANSVQIWAADAGGDMPIAGIGAGWGQLMSAPPRSGPSPYNWNQPTPGPNQTLAGRTGDGRPVAQLAHHGDADHTIPYTGGPKFGSRWILYPEPESDAVWAKHNGCTGGLSNPHNLSATYMDRTTHMEKQTTAIYWKYSGCPAVAPVEYYQIVGAPHGGANTIDGKDAFEVVFSFWERVEQAYGGALPSVLR